MPFRVLGDEANPLAGINQASPSLMAASLVPAPFQVLLDLCVVSLMNRSREERLVWRRADSEIPRRLVALEIAKTFTGHGCESLFL